LLNIEKKIKIILRKSPRKDTGIWGYKKYYAIPFLGVFKGIKEKKYK
jgi:hypothetical protein